MTLKESKAKILLAIKKNKILYISFLIIIIVFSITRLPFFLYYPVVNLDSDSPYYYTNVDQMDKGMWPSFMIRTPGYALFLKLVFFFFDKNISLIAIQNLLSLLTSLFFVYIIHRVYHQRSRFLPLLASLGMGAFISSSVHLEFDTTYMTESLYVNVMVVFFALFIQAIYSKSKIIWILGSICMATVILIRPSALFFIVVSIIIIFFLLNNRKSYKKVTVVLFICPFVVILFLMSLYNYLTIGSFSVSTFTENALISFTATFLEKSPAYPPGVNKAIEKSQNTIRPSQRDIMENSWDRRKLSRVLTRHYNRNRKLIFDTLNQFEEGDSYGLYMKWRPILKEMSMDAIKNRPKIFIKYIYANLVTNFFHRLGDFDFYQRIKPRYLKALKYKNHFTQSILDWDKLRFRPHSLQLYSTKDYVMTLSEEFPKSFLKEYWHPEVFSRVKIKKTARKEAEIIPTFLQRIHQAFSLLHRFIFRNNFWIFIFFFTLLYSFIKLWRSRFIHKNAFILFTMTLSALLHGIVVSVASVPHLRLTYPMNFIYYLSLFMFPIIIDFDASWRQKIKAKIKLKKT